MAQITLWRKIPHVIQSDAIVILRIENVKKIKSIKTSGWSSSVQCLCIPIDIIGHWTIFINSHYTLKKGD